MMPSSNPTLTFKNLQIIHSALSAGVLLFLFVAFMVNQNPIDLLPADKNNTLILCIAAGMAILCLAIGTAAYKGLLQKIDRSLPVAEKFPKYVSVCLIHWALLEGAALFNVVIFLLSGALLSAGIALLLVAVMLSTRPSRQQVTEDLQIHYPQILE